MNFSLESIRSKVDSDKTLANGRAMAENGRVGLDGINAVGSRETEIKGVVGTGIETQEKYNTKLIINDGNIRAFTCNCIGKGISMCVHCTATAFAYYIHLYQNTAMRTSTAQFMKDTMDNYIRYRVFDEMEQEEGTILLLPKIILGNLQGMSFKLSNGNVEYLISDLGEFYNRMKSGAEHEYGKQLIMKHNALVFTKESRNLLSLMIGAIEEEAEASAEYAFKSKAVARRKCLSLKRSYMDDIAKTFIGREVELELPDKTKTYAVFEEKNPEVVLRIKETLLGGYRLESDRAMYSFMLGRRLCVCPAPFTEAFLCDAEYTKVMSDLLIKMNADAYREDNFTVGKRDMAMFCGQMLPIIKDYALIDTGSLELETVLPQKLEAEFKFDVNQNGNIVCRENLYYGEFMINPVKGGSMPVNIVRDYTKEYKIKMLVEKYLHGTADEEGNLVVRAEEDIYRLLEEGIAQFMEIGSVYVSDKFKNIRISSAPKLSVGARMNESVLELDIDIEDFDKEELRRLLESYRLRKKYYRLKNGDFVRLEDNSLSVISEISEALEFSAEEFEKMIDSTIFIPKYRALYIDSVLNQAGDIHLNRDKNYRQLVRGMKEMADSDFEVPDTLVSVLRKYQRTGYRWLRTLAENGFGGILADDMGLGKTLQIITLLLADKEKRAQDSPVTPSLIVCPASLVYNWENEIRRFAPQLDSLVISGSAEERKALLDSVSEQDIIITSYDSLRRDMNYYKKLEFAFQVIDEAQFIKNPTTQNAKSVKEIRAGVKFALTGTPIENRLSELWSIFDYLMPGFLYSYTRFRDEIENRIVKEEDGVALRRLQTMIKPFVLRRLKKDVLKDLPEKQETVVYSKLDGEQRQLYDAMLSQFREDILSIPAESFGAERMNILAKLMRLRQICCEPSLCFENYNDTSAKLETCVELVKGAVDSGHKILLFSQFTSMLEIIASRLVSEDISFYTLTGDVPKEERIKLADAFNNDDTKVFLISLKAGSTGLNLTGADIVIHYDPWWNVAVQNQATDRAHRIGQLRKVNVYKLIAKNSIEEKILKLQEGKERLANQVVSDEVSGFSAFSKEELLKLFE